MELNMITSDSRYVSQLTRDSLALVLAGGKGSRLCELTASQAKPALHFGGKFRVIDFPLSNCINSGIRQIGVITQYKAYSLIRHLVQGWGHLNRELGEFVELLPASQQRSDNWYQGTADALYQNIEFIREQAPKYVVVLAGDHVYKMDYGDMLANHVESGADMTVSCIELPIEQAANSFGVMQINSDDRIINFAEKPQHPHELAEKPGYTLASMGNYIFNTEFLIEQLCKDAQMPSSQHDFGIDMIPNVIKSNKINAYKFRSKIANETPYWRDVGTLDSFWQANMDLTHIIPQLNIYDDEWPIWTHQKQYPPAKFLFNDESRCGYAVDSMVAGGCIVSGAKIEKSLLFSNVRVNSYAEVSQSVILPQVEIGRFAKINKAIIETGCKIPEGFTVGIDAQNDISRGFRISDNGVVLVTNTMLDNLNKSNAPTEALPFPIQNSNSNHSQPLVANLAK
jgi:glucose-1-phosphate adenylyltransferase